MSSRVYHWHGAHWVGPIASMPYHLRHISAREDLSGRQSSLRCKDWVLSVSSKSRMSMDLPLDMFLSVWSPPLLDLLNCSIKFGLLGVNCLYELWHYEYMNKWIGEKLKIGTGMKRESQRGYSRGKQTIYNSHPMRRAYVDYIPLW